MKDKERWQEIKDFLERNNNLFLQNRGWPIEIPHNWVPKSSFEKVDHMKTKGEGVRTMKLTTGRRTIPSTLSRCLLFCQQAYVCNVRNDESAAGSCRCGSRAPGQCTRKQHRPLSHTFFTAPWTTKGSIHFLIHLLPGRCSYDMPRTYSGRRSLCSLDLLAFLCELDLPSRPENNHRRLCLFLSSIALQATTSFRPRVDRFHTDQRANAFVHVDPRLGIVENSKTNQYTVVEIICKPPW